MFENFYLLMVAMAQRVRTKFCASKCEATVSALAASTFIKLSDLMYAK